MREVLENDEAASRPGLLQGIDPRVKLLSIVGFAVAVSFLQSIVTIAAMILLTLGVAAASRVSSLSFARKVWASAGIFSVLIAAPAITSWITPGPAFFSLGPVSLTTPGLYVATRLVLRGVAGRRKQHAGGCQHGRAFQAKFHSLRTGWICRFSFRDTSPGSATSFPCCRPERTSILVGFAIPTVISVRCKRLFVTTKTNRLRPSMYTAPRGTVRTFGRSLI